MRFIVIVFFLISCGSEAEYSRSMFPFFLNGEALEIKGESINGKESGKYEYTIDENQTITGRYVAGQKLGLWDYSLKNIKLKIDWSIYTEKNERFSFAFPGFWILSEGEEADVLFSTDKSNANLKFVIYEHELEVEIGLEYLSDYMLALKENNELISMRVFKINGNKQEFYYIESKVKSTKNSYYFYGLLSKSSNKIYDLTYVSDDAFPVKDEIVFFDFLYGTFINGQRLLSPFANYIVSPVRISDVVKI